MKNIFLFTGACSGFISVALGAFAAHFLKSRLDATMLEVFKTGVLYQFFHSLALVLVGILAMVSPQTSFKVCGILFGLGIVFFSGSLYLLAVTGVKAFGAVTPIGGVLFLLGWVGLVAKS